jgi:hypothetical protein
MTVVLKQTFSIKPNQRFNAASGGESTANQWLIKRSMPLPSANDKVRRLYYGCCADNDADF